MKMPDREREREREALPKTHRRGQGETKERQGDRERWEANRSSHKSRI